MCLLSKLKKNCNPKFPPAARSCAGSDSYGKYPDLKSICKLNCLGCSENNSFPTTPKESTSRTVEEEINYQLEISQKQSTFGGETLSPPEVFNINKAILGRKKNCESDLNAAKIGPKIRSRKTEKLTNSRELPKKKDQICYLPIAKAKEFAADYQMYGEISQEY